MTTRPTTENGSQAIPWRSPFLHVILASSLIGVMGVSLLSPVLPALRAAFDITDSQVGLIITVYTLPGILLTPFVGLVADRLGRRRTLIPLLFIFGTAGTAIAVTNTFEMVLVLRFVQGIGASALITLAITLIGDYYEGQRQRSIVGINSSAIGTGAALYPLIGGALAAIRWNVPFLFFGVAFLVGIAAALILEEPAVDAPPSLRTYLKRVVQAVTRRDAFGIYVASFATFFLFYGGVLTAIPLLLTDEYGVVEPYLGFLLAIVSFSNAITASFYGRLEPYFDLPSLVAFGFTCFGLALLGIRVVTSPAEVGLLLVIFGVGFGIVMPSLNASIVSLAADHLRASMLGTQTSMLRIGQTIGPIAFTGVAAVGFEKQLAGYRVVLPVAGLLSILAAVTGWLYISFRS
ncbi:MFS transporter [Natrinema halophilum]|uniref:MFS transporter n=1 Tax=Natrinema halophilum TaxID=1699371 RepID=UPI001F2A1E43|nr:MFS transporter [Natrinema halophilum]UHQ96191.1 MFS transporter [Natrinema halophilum]